MNSSIMNLMPNKKGFTLVELLVVITIIALLAVAGITVYSGVQKNARDARRKADIDSIAKAWEAHIAKTSPYYPVLSADWFAAGTIPLDPSSGSNYNYVTGAISGTTGTDTYKVCATLGDNSTACTATSATSTPPCYCQSNQQ